MVFFIVVIIAVLFATLLLFLYKKPFRRVRLTATVTKWIKFELELDDSSDQSPPNSDRASISP